MAGSRRAVPSQRLFRDDQEILVEGIKKDFCHSLEGIVAEDRGTIVPQRWQPVAENISRHPGIAENTIDREPGIRPKSFNVAFREPVMMVKL